MNENKLFLLNYIDAVLHQSLEEFLPFLAGLLHIMPPSPVYMLYNFFSFLPLQNNLCSDVLSFYLFLRLAADGNINRAEFDFFLCRWPISLSLDASNWVLESTKHDDLLNVVVIAGVPEVFDDFLDWGLSKYSINFIVDDRSHETGIDIKVMDCFNLNPIMLIC